MAFERRFRMCERVVHVVEIAYFFTDCSTTTKQQNKVALTINVRWQNFFALVTVVTWL
jgi:hypothetical protein